MGTAAKLKAYIADFAVYSSIHPALLNITYKDSRTNIWIGETYLNIYIDMISNVTKNKGSCTGHINLLKDDR